MKKSVPIRALVSAATFLCAHAVFAANANSLSDYGWTDSDQAAYMKIESDLDFCDQQKSEHPGFTCRALTPQEQALVTQHDQAVDEFEESRAEWLNAHDQSLAEADQAYEQSQLKSLAAQINQINSKFKNTRFWHIPTLLNLPLEGEALENQQASDALDLKTVETYLSTGQAYAYGPEDGDGIRTKTPYKPGQFSDPLQTTSPAGSAAN